MVHDFDRYAPMPTLTDLPAGVVSADGKTFDPKVFGLLVQAARTLLEKTLVSVAAETQMHHSTLSKIDAGKAVSLQKCARLQRYLEEAGIEFPEGTREIVLRYSPSIDRAGVAITVDPTMPAGTRFVHPRTLGPEDLISSLKEAGVRIEGEDTLRAVLEMVNDWCAMLVRMVVSGRTGVRFTRAATNGPSESYLVALLRPFPFADSSARREFVRHIVALDLA
ncbi:hypothetical protein N7638_17425 [Achromobacter mucicolens]|uniref:Uncharacterized protein n=1 Tax=Achromobacter aegrifaciens TaxID=1287736 RepID=A0AAD2J4M2_ACHAE|nr:MULTISPECIES: hypothetical protein [Achromobacter]MDG9969825.1 hypothetical protein [Achromobacter mucicolens]CAB3894278.1 hypothetical protein LMG26684_04261 [Achromobacter mucicolens]CUJ70678.1 Uncharacterised protein [Achromobacter aegrifaciens]